MDFVASHNITGDLTNLSIHLEYDDIDKVMLGDGLGSVVSHIGSPKITLKKFHFKLYTLCPQFVQKSNFCSLLYFQKQCFY